MTTQIIRKSVKLIRVLLKMQLHLSLRRGRERQTLSKVFKVSLHGHLQNIFKEQWLLKYHVITKNDRVKCIPKLLQIVISGLT